MGGKMRLRITYNIRKCLSGLMLFVLSPNLKCHFSIISCVQVVVIAVIFVAAIISVITLPLVIRRSFDFSYMEITQVDFRRRGNENEYFKAGRWHNSNMYKQGRRNFELEYENNLWTRISDTVYVYSAYLDTRNYARNLSKSNLSLIRIIGIIRMPPARDIIRTNLMRWLHIKDETFLGNKYYCKIFEENEIDGKMISTPGHTMTYTIIEEGVKIFSAAYFNCYVNLANITNKNEMYVSVHPAGVEEYPDKMFPVRRIEQRHLQDDIKLNFSVSVCVRPLFGPMDDLPKLVQFISYYFSMGVTRFTFYDLSISPRIKKYLVNLYKTGEIVITLNHWNLPTGNVSELWDFGTLAALNDCLYNNMLESRVIFVDIDEYIVPQSQYSSKLNFATLFKNYENYHQLLVRNTFFCTEFCQKSNNSGTDDKNIFQLNIWNCTTRTKKIWNAELRGKYIVNPIEIVSVGHHLVTKYVNQIDYRFTDKSHIMKTNVALLYHYRDCRPISTLKHPILNRLTIKDDRITLFKETMKSSLPHKVFIEFGFPEATHNVYR